MEPNRGDCSQFAITVALANGCQVSLFVLSHSVVSPLCCASYSIVCLTVLCLSLCFLSYSIVPLVLLCLSFCCVSRSAVSLTQSVPLA